MAAITVVRGGIAGLVASPHAAGGSPLRPDGAGSPTGSPDRGAMESGLPVEMRRMREEAGG